MIEALHVRRDKHKRLMREAQHLIQLSRIDAATSNAYSLAGFRTTGDFYAKMGWEEVRSAIDTLVRCGCPRDLWPETVQTAIPEAGNENTPSRESSGRLSD